MDFGVRSCQNIQVGEAGYIERQSDSDVCIQAGGRINGSNYPTIALVTKVATESVDNNIIITIVSELLE
ncbi:MAG: hypothetical protein EZS28_026220 [Streblomastix strix]|uniref:Uncharacterized protein n=1 Tax=Streblomastix strix TaxID=222440 RepID=A0A5J4V767_9EUKA|nr:MAG: hypothetical protein EZS28_026220 [Streblomastix strix]